nr:hypothetical protein Hi04_10k_c3807_00012 [uncultured bacterium]
MTLALACAACGGLDNRPLEVGSVSGTLPGCDPSLSVVGVVGNAAAQGVPDGTCAFRLDGLPPGPLELFAVASDRKVALVDAQVRTAELTAVGAIETRNGAFVHLHAAAPSHQKVMGHLSAPDVPLPAAAFQNAGMATIGPFPPGCFRVEAMATGLGIAEASPCLPDENDTDVDVLFSEPDGSVGRDGCISSGCDEGFICSATGDCR